MAYKFQLGTAIMSGNLWQEGKLILSSSANDGVIHDGYLSASNGTSTVHAFAAGQGNFTVNAVGATTSAALTAAGVVSSSGVNGFEGWAVVVGDGSNVGCASDTNLLQLSKDLFTVNGLLEATGKTTLSGAVDLGNAAADEIKVRGEIGCDRQLHVSGTFATFGNSLLGNAVTDVNSSLGEFHCSGTMLALGAFQADGNVTLGNAAGDDIIVTGEFSALEELHASGTILALGALTADGATTLNGAVTLGNATGDDLTFTGLAASDFVPKTDSAYDLGSNTKAWQTIYVDSIVGASVAWDVVLCDSADTISASVEFALVREGNGITVSMPEAVAGRNIRVKLSASVGDVILDCQANDSIEGKTSIRLEATGSAVTLVAYDAESWFII
jgi:hypothetical protein